MTTITQPRPSDPGRIDRAERRWVFGFALAVLLVTSLPYFVAFAAQGTQWRFSGFVFGVYDGNSYIANMLSGAKGAWLFRTPYTTMPQQGVLLFLPYLLLGKLAASPALHEQLVALSQLYRWVAGLLEILATYEFLACFVFKVTWRRLGLVVATLGGGLGWMLVLLGSPEWLGSMGLEFYSPETFGFLGLYGIAHAALARASMLWVIVIYLRYAGGWKRRPPLLASGLWILAWLAQPIVSVLLFGVLGLHLLAQVGWSLRYFDPARRVPIWKYMNWRPWLQRASWVAMIGIVPAMLIIYQALAVRDDAFLQTWWAQNIIRSPNPIHYLLAYGLLLPLAWAGGRRLMSANAQRAWLPVMWVLVLPILAYAPVDMQRRLPDGLWVALVALAIAGLEGWQANREIRGSPARLQTLLPVLPLALTLPSTFLLLTGGFIAAAQPAEPVFQPAGQAAAFEYMADNLPEEPGVLAAFETSNAMPAWALVHTIIGHGPLSANSAELEPEVDAFYHQETTQEQRLAWLRAWGIDYVFWGPNERRLGKWDPEQAPYLKPVDPQATELNGDYRLFQVSLPRVTQEPEQP